MGMLIKGRWTDQWYDTDSSGGEFVRQQSGFRNRISAVDGGGRHPAVSGRYHLFVAKACPWAHRTLIFRTLKGLEEHISVSVVNPLMLENGWEFAAGGDPLTGKRFLYEVYLAAAPDYEGRVTVPVLWDKARAEIVNNESAEIIRIFNSDFNALTGNHDDYYPQALREQIDAWNERIYDRVNNGVYKAGFATSQQAYEKACRALFAELDHLEQHLRTRAWLLDDTLTEADWRLFTTLLRFDPVYHGHFKCNLRKLSEYPNLSRYLAALCEIPGVADTFDVEATKLHYYGSHKTINPTGIVPLGPA